MQYASVVRVPIYNNEKSFGMPLYRAFPKDLLMKYNYVPTFPNEKNIGEIFGNFKKTTYLCSVKIVF